MTIQRIGQAKRMSQAVAHGDTIYLSGQVATKSAGQGVASQAREILEGIDALLTQAGSDKSRVLSASIWLADIATFAEMNEVWDEWVAPDAAPARATVEAKLASPDYKIEIAVIAAR
ncbi:RidA family protein [Novosphingobium pentaromativorans]|uniref:Endoribonuclease L-PSP n=1 Tax=Novosphingobium pentaromativorans US6-1 TaxID=1088721 RepID=G6EGN2_9SPHN|nr:RidA family protein [Novosphingobium pentaromativorans]AIT82143.1 endoribonuclease [Novosphingobium pentaromativorans US6-1]EHJ59579.1 Endoribonuclease L-PSP [Novosphingobium pentaromativorans US6-1]